MKNSKSVRSSKTRFQAAPPWLAHVLSLEEKLLIRFKDRIPTQAELHNQDNLGSTDFVHNKNLDLLAAERMVPGKNYSPYMVQHVARYLWAMSMSRGEKVLDLGCGDGYGTFMLSWVAESAAGIDVNQVAIQESISQYSSSEGLASLSKEEQTRIYPDDDQLQSLIKSLPKSSWAPIYKIADLTQPQSFPQARIGVCFEVLEHLHNPEEVLNSIARSSLERAFFSVPNPLAGGSHINPHHVNNWSLRGIKNLLRESGARKIKTYRQGLKRYQIKRGASYLDLNWLFVVDY